MYSDKVNKDIKVIEVIDEVKYHYSLSKKNKPNDPKTKYYINKNWEWVKLECSYVTDGSNGAYCTKYTNVLEEPYNDY